MADNPQISQTAIVVPGVPPTPHPRASQLAVIAVASDKPLASQGARAFQFAMIFPSADVAIPSVGARVSELVYVVPGYFREDKSPTHGYSIKSKWVVPLIVQGGV